ncbi:MAG TPA: phosphoribosylformylglycinamidine synthase subunit PurL [Saprospiraceae bacterium]|nr:phosphoribosylformylglycinamidine synthase subunit PurL [Saprospiraceae bacterium]
MQDTEVAVDYKVAGQLGLTKDEFEKICSVLGREPNFTELSIYSVMWSEHCSYKNSIKYLKTLPRNGGRLLVAAGEENAGLMDIGDGLACAFKIESHNHPSALEPYQGAATGVGGIHRDIFTMGARPIAALNSLRFGDPRNSHMRHLIKGVVSGIGDYGNCLGVPTVAGEVYFDPSYQQNILVNAMSVGIVKIGETISASADGPGNPVFIVGSATGRDGIHGATFASADLTEDSAEDLPAVQVGDPFQEKLLLEATLEIIKTGAVVGMQDMGAAGITCSTSEMSAKSGTGMKINLDLVPTRQQHMAAWEILLSESQERMLVIVKKGREAEIQSVFDKWDLECALIGEVTDTGNLEYFRYGEKVAQVPAFSLVLGGGAPVYDRESKRPAYMDQIKNFTPTVPSDSELIQIAQKIISSPNIASKRWVYEQYDHTVRTGNTNTNDASDATIVRLKNSKKSLAVTVDCNSMYVHADPYIGTMIAVSEAARNIRCSGGIPVGVTNCLNFGNPYNPEVYYQFVNAIKGMGEACRKYETPVTGGNVSFYNQSVLKDSTEPVFPTPTIGMVGLVDRPELATTISFKKEGDVIILLGPQPENANSSVYFREILQERLTSVPEFDLNTEYSLHLLISELIEKSMVQSVHDISEGGLFANLIESAIANRFGFEIATPQDSRKDIFLFSESQSRVVVSVSLENFKTMEGFLTKQAIPFLRLGTVRGSAIVIDEATYGDISSWNELYQNALTLILEQ